MKIHGICADCKHFEHECYLPMGEDDYGCTEHCNHPIGQIRDLFYDLEDIESCEGFEKDH